MSIQPGRVLWRIVDEVDRAPRARLSRSVWEGPAFRDAAQGERLEVARVALPPSGGAQPFATLLHFWTHALREWLDALGQADQLVGAAGYAMCESLDEAGTKRELARLGERLAAESSALHLQLEGPFAEAYRMIDGSCRSSFVVATGAEWLSVTWGHGFERTAVLPTQRAATRNWQLHPTP